MNDSALDALWEIRLAMIDGVGPRTRFQLVDRFGSAQAVFEAPDIELRQVAGVGPKVVRSLHAPPPWSDVESAIDECTALGIDVLPTGHGDYPQVLSQLPDPPGVLYKRGELLPADARSIAIVGTRHATPYGLAQAHRFSVGLVQAGYTIISGLARGIDAAAHRGALEAGGRTIGVLGSGLASIYPPEHVELAEQVSQQGCLLSEQPPRSPPTKFSFPQRNRIVTGMSLGVLVVEAADRSGALISGHLAAEQGRDVFAIPGRIDSRMSRGCHQLIREGAKLVESVDDILDELSSSRETASRGVDGRRVDSRHASNQSGGSPAPVQRTLLPVDLTDDERAVLAAMTDEPLLIDQVTVQSKLPISRVLSLLSQLEMKKLIGRVGGNRVHRR